MGQMTTTIRKTRKLMFRFRLVDLSCQVMSVNGKAICEVPKELENEFQKLLDHLDHFTKQIAQLNLDELDVDKFLSKVFRMRAEWEEGLRDAPAERANDMEVVEEMSL
jgi:hypothetical protein